MAWPSDDELNRVKGIVSEISGRKPEDVRVVISPYRICPLGAHIDHQGGTVSAMTINKGILLGFVPSGDTKVLLRSEQFEGDVMFSNQAPLEKMVKVPLSVQKGETIGDILQEELSMHCRVEENLLLRE